MMYRIFGCPMHYGVGAQGLTGSIDYLNRYCGDLNLTMLPEISMPEDHLPNLKNINSVLANCRQIAEHGRTALQEGMTPLYLAGDHSCAIGTVSAAAACYDNLGLVWIDAHPDINTDATTLTGNIHGMPVAALLGMGEKSLTEILNDRPKIKAGNLVMLGLRDIDPPEKAFLKDLNIRYFTYRDMEKQGISSCVEACISHLSGLDHVHISFDVDVMDPALLPGVSVPVPGGLLPRDAFRIMDTLTRRLPIVSCDIVEFNAARDSGDRTAEFVCSMIQKILQQR